MKTHTKQLKNGNTVEWWYDRRVRSWCIRTVDACGNQIGDADYAGHVDSLRFCVNKRSITS